MRPGLTERSERKSVAECDPTPSMYYVYVLRNRQTGQNSSPELVYYEAYKAEADARRREWQLKRHAQALTALKMRLKESIR